MKASSIFFATYLFCLAVYPCSDRNTCEDEIRAGVELSSADTHDHSNVEQDLCSPFCICQCCSTHAQQPVYFNLSSPSHLVASDNNTYIPEKILAVAHTFWQPPKLS